MNATAYDLYGNLKRDYGGGATLTGNLVNAPNGAQPQYGTFGAWANGSASDSGVTSFATSSYDASTHAYNADFSVTVSDSGKTATSNQFAVKPGPLASFGWTSQPNASQNAGIPFGAGVTAYDAYGNVKTDYSGSAATVGGLGTSPGNFGPSYTVAWADGVSAGTFVDYKAEHTHLTVTDGSITADSSSFDVAPGPLTSFAWSGPGASQTAGVPFGATVTASDAYGNAVSSYTGGSTFALTGLHPSPNGTPPSYGSVSWSGGVGTFTGITDSDAETTTITAADGTATGTSGSFTVQTADPAKLTFSLQPNDTQQFSNGPSCNSPAVCLIATTIHNEDAFGNLEVNVPVKVTLGQNPGGDVLDGRTNGECSAGTCTATTNGNGDASFTDLTMQKIATGYTLLASSGPTTTQSGPPTATQESGLFNVAQTVKKCNGTARRPRATSSTTSRRPRPGSAGISRSRSRPPGSRPAAGSRPGRQPRHGQPDESDQ